MQVLPLLHHFIGHVVHGCLPLRVSFQPLLRQADVLGAAAATAAARAAGVVQLTRQILVPGVQLRRDLQEQKKRGVRGRCRWAIVAFRGVSMTVSSN